MNIKTELTTMFNFKSITLILFLAFATAGCGTDGLSVEEQSLSFSNTEALGNADFASAGQQYSFTVEIENGPAADSRLTAFSENGDWLNAQVVNGGSAIELTGTPSNSQAGSFYNFYLAGNKEDGSTATTFFGIFVGS